MFLLVKAQVIIQKHSLCYGMNFFFEPISQRCCNECNCCYAIVVTNCVHFESVDFDPPAIKYSQC